MRISDWSSDVCSSDLGKIERIPDLDTFPQGCPPGARLPSYPCGEWGGFVWYSLNPDVEPLEQYLDPMPQHLNPYHMERMAWVRDITEIGRASCRERVCQYV